MFGLPSPEIDPLLAQLGAHDIRLVPVRHEAAGVHMAEGLYKTTGQVAVVLGNPGPGSANLLPGVITARHEGVPVVAITSQHRLGIVYPSPPSTFQGQDQLDVFKPAVKWGGPILSWERIPEVVRLAFREMWTGRPGPVHIELPAPVLYATGDGARRADRAAVRLPCAAPAGVGGAAAARRRSCSPRAQRPLVVAGAGVDRADANAALLEIVALLDCPVITTMAGRSSVPLDHRELCLRLRPRRRRRQAGGRRRPGGRIASRQSRPPVRQVLGRSGAPAAHPDRRRSAQHRRDAAAGARHRCRRASRRSKGWSRVLRAQPVTRRDGADLARYREAAQAWWNEQLAPIAGWTGPGIHPAHAHAGDRRASSARDAIYVADGGNTSLWAHSCLPPTRPRSYHSILELGMLGTGIPSAIGAKLGAPDREVVCVTGDGAAGFNFMEMQSAAREGREDHHRRLRRRRRGRWRNRTSGCSTAGRSEPIKGTVRWDTVAEGLGCHGEYAERIDDVGPALQRAQGGRPGRPSSA